MSKLKIFLKSGQTIDVECDYWKFDYATDYEFIGYKLTGLKNIEAMSLVPNQIAGFIELKTDNEDEMK